MTLSSLNQSYEQVQFSPGHYKRHAYDMGRLPVFRLILAL